MKAFILSQVAVQKALLANNNNGYPILSDAEFTIITKRMTEVHESIIDIITEHTTAKLDFEGMGNMISSMFIKHSRRTKLEDDIWVYRRAKAMAMTALELAIMSADDVSSEYKNELLKKKRFVNGDNGRKKLITFDWHRNYFSCHGEYESESLAYLETGEFPRGLSRTAGELGSGTVSDPISGVVIKLSKHHKNKLRQLASVRHTWRKLEEKELFDWMKSSDSFKEQMEATRSKTKLVKKYKAQAQFVSQMGDEESIYSLYRYQSSGRFQAMFGMQDVGFHTGGKLLWRFAFNRVVSWEDTVMARFIVTQLWSKATRKKPLSFKQAQKTYKSRSNDILEWLSTYESYDLVKGTYWKDVRDEILLKIKGGKTNIMLHVDLTASGSITHALSFHSKKLGGAVNMTGNKIPRDFHSEMMDRSPLNDRDLVKQEIQNPWTHGSGLKRPADAMGVDVAEFREILSSAYGPEALYPEMIGGLTSDLTTGNDQIIFMKRADGFLSFGKSYYQGGVSNIKYPSCMQEKVNIIKMFGNEPIRFGNNNKNKVINVSKTEDINGKIISKAQSGAKIRHLHAIGSHAVESMGTSWVYDKVTQPLASVHDDYFSTGKGLFQVFKHLKSFHLWVYDNAPVQGMIKDAFDRKGIDIDVDAMFPKGTLTRAQVAASQSFLQP